MVGLLFRVYYSLHALRGGGFRPPFIHLYLSPSMHDVHASNYMLRMQVDLFHNIHLNRF
jgi:hypothetical protein